MAAAVAAVVMEEDVADMVVAEAVVSHICTLSPPVPSADGTNKDAGRRLHLF
jgi:hypothetical protein